VIQERIAIGERNFLKRPYRKFLAKQLHDYEMAVLDRVDGVAAISPADAQHFAGTRHRNTHRHDPLRCGTSEYLPATEAAWRADLLPPGQHGLVAERGRHPLVVGRGVAQGACKRPNARLHLAGNKMPEDLLDTGTTRVSR
jgi:hypothetical protein